MTTRILPKIITLAALGLVTLGGSSMLARASETAGVTAMKLQDADSDAGSWLWYGRDLSAHRYSPLTALDSSSVSGLSLAWKKTLGPAVSM